MTCRQQRHTPKYVDKIQFFEHDVCSAVVAPRPPYAELPRLPPRKDLETKVILKQCINARAALAELKQATELIPNSSVPINTIPLLEAKDSSEIENIVTTADRLFLHAAGHDGHADPKPGKPCVTGLRSLLANWERFIHDERELEGKRSSSLTRS